MFIPIGIFLGKWMSTDSLFLTKINFEHVNSSLKNKKIIFLKLN